MYKIAASAEQLTNLAERWKPMID